MKNFRDLRAWQEAHTMTLNIYRNSKVFPKDELFGLTSQLRRSTVSIEANLAEGCGRQGDGELARFVHIALGSASETECHLLIAKDLGYLSPHSHTELQARLEDVRRMLTGLLRVLGSSGERKAEGGGRKARAARA